MTTTARLVLSVLLLITSLLPSVASAQEDLLAPIREQVLYASYPEAIRSANTLLARSDLDARTRNGALELLATAQIASRLQDEARATLATLYSRDPGYRLSDPDASPPVVSAFARAREARAPAVTVTLQHRVPTLVQRESPSIDVRATTNADALDELRLVYRHGTDSGWSRVVMNRRPDGTYTARIPVVGPTDQPVDVIYYVVGVAPSGTELAHQGSEGEPLSLRIPAERRIAAQVEAPRTDVPLTPTPAPASHSVTEEWWFWTILGVAVAGGAVAGVVVATESQGIPDGTLGTVTLAR